ncbi:hypothetical protein [Pseudomonas fluorescens]|nr:hypothetical protein [Pseudomonas fluorescens]
MLESTIADALHLVNAMLDEVNTACPGIETRFEIEGVSGEEEEDAKSTVEPV